MTTEIQIETGEASCLGTTKLLLVIGKLDIVEGTGDLRLLDSNIDCSGRLGKKIKGGIKQV